MRIGEITTGRQGRFSPPAKRRRRRRGISTVVTSAMLISAVSLMGTFLVSWSGTSFEAQRLSIAGSVDDRVNQIRESFVVEDAWFFANATGKYAKVTVRNTGDAAIKVSAIYLNNTQVFSAAEGGGGGGGQATIPKDGAQPFTFQSEWGQGKSQSVWVKTERGGESRQVWKS